MKFSVHTHWTPNFITNQKIKVFHDHLMSIGELFDIS